MVSSVPLHQLSEKVLYYPSETTAGNQDW